MLYLSITEHDFFLLDKSNEDRIKMLNLVNYIMRIDRNVYNWLASSES